LASRRGLRCVNPRFSRQWAQPVRLSMVIMDEIFGQLPPLDLPLPDGPDFSLDIDLNPKDMMELEEFDFDFEEINDLGSWIATSDDSLSEEVMGVDSVNSETENERLQHFEDLDIKEAVRYDCMWTSYNEFNAQKSQRSSNNSSPTASLNLSSSFYDSLLGSIDTPENSDSSSIKSEMETDTDSEESEKRKAKACEETEEEKKSQTMSPAHIITSLDHCYNISSTHLDNERFLPRSSSGPLTPPVSSDDEDCNNSSSTNFAFSSINYNKNQARNEKGLKQAGQNRRMITTSNKAHTQSLLKRSMNRQRTISEAKFSINLKVNRQIVKQTDKSRSLLKQKVKIVRTPFTKTSSTESQLKKKLFEQHRTSQSAMRKRKERSLKMQEGEAREVHNQMERQRRNELKVAFDELKVHLPEIATSDKASKQQILDKAVETCITVRSTESSLKTRVTTLNKTNSQLKERLRKLQAEAKRRRDFPMGIADW